jgi:superoxide dismutase, Cu-Zn family
MPWLTEESTMRRGFWRAVAGGVALCGAAGLVWAEGPADAGGGAGTRATATLIDTTLVKRGNVEFIQQNDLVRVTVRVHGSTAGFHGFHVHSTGTCKNPDGTANFTLAGGHFGHDLANGVVHGNHPGDLPTVLVDDSGNGSTITYTAELSVADVVGRAVIVHAGPDNLANIPVRYGVADEATLSTGDAGARAFCGVIVPG